MDALAAVAAAADRETASDHFRHDPQFDAVDAETRAVMQSRVNSAVRDKYETENIKFMLWLYDHRENYGALVKPALLEELGPQHDRDRARRTLAGHRCKLRDYVRHTCRQWLRGIDTDRSATHPLELTDLLFPVYARYLNSFKKVARKRSRGGAQEEVVAIRLSQSAFDGATSALTHLYTECGLDKQKISNELWRNLAIYKKGSRRTSAKEKKKLGISTAEGKKHMPFAAYKKLARLLFESKKPEDIPAHTFFVLDWNLVSRAETVVESKIDVVSFTEDALVFEMGITKTDQEGTKNVDHPWHIYSCPECPEICAHLAFARHVMYNPTILSGQAELFEGRSQYERFNKIFRDYVNHPEHREEFASLGMTPADFGTHSIRKGAATHISTGSTACPPIASICLRANWAMPGVLNRYIKYENAGDQFVGKCVSGRSRNNKKFGASCAYWDFSAEAPDAKAASENRLHSYLRESLPLQARGNLKVYAVYKMAVAAIAYYRDYLAKHLHPESILRSTSLWNDDIPFHDKVVVKYPWNATDDTPEITGLPPDTVLLAEMESMKRDMAELKAELKSSFESTLIEQLDQREVGGSGFARGNEIVAKLEALIEKVSEVSRAAQAAPVVPTLPPYDDEPAADLGYGDGFVSDDEEEDVVIALEEAQPTDTSRRTRARFVQQRTQEQLAKRKIKVGYHHGHFNPLPASWRFPKGLTVIQLVHLWLVGSEKEHVPALKKLKPSLLAHFDPAGRVRSRMKFVMREVEHLARLEGVWLEGNWTSAAVITMWSTIWRYLEPYLRTLTKKNGKVSDDKSRRGQISWRTFFNKLSENGKDMVPSKIVRARDMAGEVSM